MEKQVSFPEARRLVETMSGAVAGKSYATAVKVSTTNASVQTADLTWPNGADRLKKIPNIEKVQKQATNAVFRSSGHLLQHMSLWILWTSEQPRQSKPAWKETKTQQRSASLNSRKNPETDVCSGRLKKAEQRLIPISNSYNTLAGLGDEGMDICQEGFLRNKKHQQNLKVIPYFPLMTNSVIQWNCLGIRPNFDELMIVKYNSLAVCLQATFHKDTGIITVMGFNLYHTFQVTENIASGGVSILVNENIPQSIATLNTTLQAVAVKVTAHKTITLCSVHLPPRNHFNFNPKDLQDLIDQLPSPFILMGDFNCHHTLWGCVDVNNRGQQLEDLILKNDLILFSVFSFCSGTFTSIDVTLCSPPLFLDFSWNVCHEPCGSDHFPVLLENDGPPCPERVQRWKLAKANWDQIQHLCYQDKVIAKPSFT